MKNTIIIFLLLCSIKGFSQVPITRTLSNVNNTADSLKPVSKAQASINTSLQSSINTNTSNIATNASNISTNTSNIATNTSAIILKANLTSPTFTGTVETDNTFVARNVLAGNGDLAGAVFGREYLYAFFAKLKNGGTPIVDLIGDSTTAGDAITDSNYLLQNLLNKIITQFYHTVTIFNDGVSGTNTKQWRTTYLTAQIARNPDLMVIRYGVNDGLSNRTDFESDLRAGLAQIRASRTVAQTSIILMTPSSTNDVPNGRDATWYKITDPIIRKAARDYGCTFIDTYESFYDSGTKATAWYDDPFADGRHIHPKNELNLQIASLIGSVLKPVGIEVLGSTSFENVSGTQRTPIITDATTTYPKGFSMYRVSTGWNYDGSNYTFRQNDGTWLQLNNAYAGVGMAWRSGQSSGWNAWEYPLTSLNKNYLTSNMGIGVTPAEIMHLSATNPTIRLDGSSGSAFVAQSGNGITLASNRNPVSGVFLDGAKSGAQLNINTASSGANMLFYVGSTANSLSGSDLKMIITPAGIGMGTSTPTSKIQVVGLPVYADNATALAAGLTAGAFYRTSTGILMVAF